MLNYKEAQKVLLKNVSKTDPETIDLGDADGKIVAQDILSPVSHPLFDQSAVDGYAFKLNIDHNYENDLLLVSGEVKAGDRGDEQVEEGSAVRIFTGAKVPDKVDTVVMQEDVTLKDGSISLNKEVKLGQHIRKAAEQIKEGELAIAKGSSINAATIGFLCSLGIGEAAVFKAPRVQIIITGNEFANDQDGLADGKIYESNGEMLKAALGKMGIKATFEECTDELALLQSKIQQASKETDVLIISGGVSVGDYDFTVPALLADGYDTIFHKVKQKPGKPILFSKKGDKAAFGLPGNPRAALICFYLYVLPYLNAMSGKSEYHLTQAVFASANEYTKKEDDKTHLLAGKINGVEVEILETQGSHMMMSLAAADCLVVNPEDNFEIKKGDPVNVVLLT